LTSPGAVVVNGDGANNTLVLTTVSSTQARYQLDGGPVVTLISPTSFAFNGLGGNDTLSVVYTGGGLAFPVSYDGGTQNSTPGDTLVLGGGTFTVIRHTYVNAGTGSVNLDGSVLQYTGLEPVTDNNSATNRIFDYTGGAETITLQDDGNLSNNTSRITSTLGEATTFTNPTAALTVNADAGGTNAADVVNVTSLDSGLTGRTITVNAGGGADFVNLGNGNAGASPTVNVNAGGGDDTVNVSVNAAGTVAINTQAGANDAVNIGFTVPGQSFGQGNLTGIAGTVNVTDAGDGLTLQVDDFTDPTSNNAITFNSTSITGAADAGGSIGYTNVSTLRYNLSNAAGAGDQINVIGTNATTATTIF